MTNGGALTQMIATGALDGYLTTGAVFTWWKNKYSKHTQFSMDSVRQQFNTQVAFGSDSMLTLNRHGDLVFYLYVVFELPGIVGCDVSKEGGCSALGAGSMFPAAFDTSCAPCAAKDREAYGADADGADDKAKKDQWLRDKYGHAPTLDCADDGYDDCPDQLCPELGNVWAHYTNDVGHALLKHTKLVIGGSEVDKICGDMLFMWEELSGRSGRRLTEMTGKRYTRTQLVLDSRQRRLLYVPIPFWFTQHSGSALSLASLQFHGVQLHCQFEEMNKVIVVSSKDVIVKNVDTGVALQANDLKASIETTYVFLENAERERFATNHFEVLIVQHQQFYHQANTQFNRIQLNFNHPTLEIIFAVRRECQRATNNWYNFSGIDGRDPIVEVDLKLNNQSRFGQKPGIYFRTVQPFQHHSNIPDAFIYCYSFALHPEDTTAPSGSCNLSRIDNVDLNITLQSGLDKELPTIMVFARSFNICRFREGLAGLAFSN